MTKRQTLFLLLFICLAVAFGLLLQLRTSSGESDLFLPTSFENLPDGLVMVSQPPKEVEIRIRGKRSSLGTFLEAKHACVFDLSHVSAGVETLEVDKSALAIPPDISVVHIKPKSVTLRFETKRMKSVPVDITLTDNPAPGYRVSLTLTEPSVLQISGPEKTLARIDRLATQSISVKDMTESFKKEIAVLLPEGATAGRGEKGAVPLVVAQVNIEENIIVRRFVDIPVESLNTTYAVKIAPSAVNIEVRGPEKILADLSEEKDIKAFVDLAGLAPGLYVRRAQITLPVGTTLVGASPEVFTVTIGP